MKSEVQMQDYINKIPADIFKKTELANKGSFCIYPFKSINIMPAGTIQPCCAYARPIEKNGIAMSVYEHSLDEIVNSEEMQNIRKSMISGEIVVGCEYCFSHERQGVKSMREEANTFWVNGFLNEGLQTIEELSLQTKSQEFSLPNGVEYLDLDIGNLCNLKCRMCNSTYSSGIAADDVHSRWTPTNALARWQGSTSVIAPRRVIGVAYEGLSQPDQSAPGKTAWMNGNAAIRLRMDTVDLVGFSIKISDKKPDNHPLKIMANGVVVFEGKLPNGVWESKFDFPFTKGSGDLELRFQSPMFHQLNGSENIIVAAGTSGSLCLGIDEVKLIKSEKGKSEVTFSRFSSGKQWFQDGDFLINEALKNPVHIKKLNLIGGEPLLIKEVRQILQHLIEVNVAKNITLVLTTNGTVADDEWFALAAQFKSVVVGISVDGFGAVNEYIRAPSDWKSVAENVLKFRAQPNTQVFINDTIQSYNMLNIVELVEFCKENDVPFRYHLLSHPLHLSALILPLPVRLEGARRLKPHISKNMHSSGFAKNLDQLVFALENDPTKVDREAIKEFMTFTNDLDQSRNQSILEACPQLVEHLEAEGFPWINNTKFLNKNGHLTAS